MSAPLPHLPPRITLGRMLECAVILHWQDIVRAQDHAAIHIECGAGTGSQLAYLKLWSCTTRGAWDLVCEYHVTEPPSTTHFFGRFSSPALAEALDDLMRRQRSFQSTYPAGSTGLVQVSSPTAQDTDAARACFHEASARG